MIFCTKNLAESQKSCIFVASKQSYGNIDVTTQHPYSCLLYTSDAADD